MTETKRQFATFIGVGLLATLSHYAVLIGLVETSISGPVIATAAGAVVGAIVSYLLNRSHTFQSERSHRQAVPPFVIIAILAVLLNAGLMSFMTQQLTLPYLVAQVISTGLIIILTFGGNKFWTFRK